MRHRLVLHILPRNLKSLKNCFLPEAFLNYCHQNREQLEEKGRMCIWGCSLHHGDALRKAFCGADELTPAFLLFPTIFYVRKLADKTAAAAFSPLSWDFFFYYYCHYY